MLRFLTLETTCDETAAAVVTDTLQVLGAAVATQDDLHRRFQGVVPEIAARAHVERILPVIHTALERAACKLTDLDVVAVATTPGLAGSLLIGLVAAKSLALALDLPLVAVNHLHAHVFACQLAAGRPIFPCVGLVVSGGHSSLYDCRSAVEFDLLGGTIDDAAGEAFDKVATLLGLAYPGGPAISRAAERGDPRSYELPRAFLHDEDRLEFSFSGLKTAVRYKLMGTGNAGVAPGNWDPQMVADMAASFQEAVTDVLVAKSLAALKRTGYERLCVGGGVAANHRLRARLAEALAGHEVELHIAPLSLCTDNAVMGAIAVERYRAGLTEPLSLDIQPGLLRPGRPRR